MRSFIVLLSLILVITAQNKGKYWTAISECLTEHSMGIEDLKKFDMPADKMEENMLCFNKCFYEKITIINKDGGINTDNLKSIPLVNLIDESKYDDLESCLREIGKVEECKQLIDVEKCFVDKI